MNFGPEPLVARLAALAADAGPLHLTVALSGGADSAALLHALARVARGEHAFERGPQAEPALRVQALDAIHVDHGLQAAAGELRAAARRVAAACGVPLRVLDVRVDARGESVEAAARDARYAALSNALAPGAWLLTAHHLEDQAETLLLQLLRGAGLPGLAAMPASAPLGPGRVVRPLLDVPRAALVAYARGAGLEWHEDPMNVEPRYDRAYLRSEVWPRLVARWPAAAATIARTAAHAAAAQRLLDAAAEAELARVERGRALHVPALLALDDDLRAVVLRHWLAARHGVRPPAARRLALVERELLRSRGTNGPRMAWDGVELRRFGDELHLVRPLPELPAHAALWPGQPLALGGLGTLDLERGADAADGACLAVGRVTVPLSVRARSGGERLQRVGSEMRRPLKDLLREARVPPWLRDRVPVIWDAQRVVAVVLPDRTWIDADAAAAPGEAAYRLAWRDAPSMPYAGGDGARFVEPEARFR